MESAVFFALAYRLPAYQGAMAAVAARQRQEQGGTGASGSRRGPGLRYERDSPAANNARTAENAPPATAASLAALNAQLGSTWFSHRTVQTGEAVTPDG